MKRQSIIVTICLLATIGLSVYLETTAVSSARAATSNQTTTSSQSIAQLSPDAIAIRVLDNAQNLSPRDWYKKNVGTQRSLQTLLVDGYDAVRDDRTVYVAAANISLCSKSTPGAPTCLKPIIVIISFNQNISSETVDIFGQILNNWRFNQDINSQPGNCSGNNGSSCLSNKDCSSGQVCTNLKSKIVRDTKRLIDLTIIKNKLEQYRLSYQHYPNLEAGTYLANKTLSVWPSWQKTLATKLGSSLPLDPINKLGTCSGFDSTTCWNEQQRSFATTWPILPSDSSAYQYEFVNNTRYKLCANFETNYQNIISYDCVGNHDNNGPIINCPAMRSAAGQPFTGYADIFDNEGDLINQNITYQQINAPGGWNGWGNLTVLLVDNRQRIKITSPLAGPDGRYNISLTATDSLGASTTQQCTIIIGNGLCGNDAIDSGEDCENNQGIATSSVDSTASQQYACNQYCRFTGGWCGDNIIQNGQNFTLNREQCDGSTGIATKTNDSGVNHQYACVPSNTANACKFTGGYCGDHIIQASANNLINEQCDRLASSSIPAPADTYGGLINRYQCGQPGTANACKFTGGYCGDNVIDYGYGETCEAATYLVPSPANSSSTKQYSCAITTCLVTGGWCGDETIQNAPGENCDCKNNSKNCAWAGNASSSNPNPAADSSAANLHRCQNCVQTGGWCGDGIVQNPSETCDPQESLSVFKARVGNNKINQAYYNQFTAACTAQRCHLTCYDQDQDDYGLNGYTACTQTTTDCEDRPAGNDGLLNSPDDGYRINPGQPDNCTQYDGIDNNCNGLIDDKGWLNNPSFTDTFAENITGSYHGSKSNVTLDTTSGFTDSRSALLQQDPNYTDWPNTCTNLNHPTGNDCNNYASLAALNWDVNNLGLTIGQDYVVSFNYKGSANFLHPTTTTSINEQITTPANQTSWVLGYGNITASSSWVTSSANLIKPGNYTSFSNNKALGNFNYYQDLPTLGAINGGLHFYLTIGNNNTDNSGNALNIDNVAIASCQNVRTNGTYCGNGIVEGTYETCDLNLASSWDAATEFCDNTCHKGNKLRILQVYPGNSNSINLQTIIINNKDNYITNNATVTAITLDSFNDNSTTLLPNSNPTSNYNVVVFGFKDCNNGEDLTQAAASSTQNFIDNHGGVIFGHDTIWSSTACGGNHHNFNTLAHYAGIAIGDYVGNSLYSSVLKNNTLPTDSQMFRNPYILPTTPFTVLETHTSGPFPSSTLCTAPDGLKTWYSSAASSTQFWATTCGRVEHIILGHTVGLPNINEQRALINMLYYVATN